MKTEALGLNWLMLCVAFGFLNIGLLEVHADAGEMSRPKFNTVAVIDSGLENRDLIDINRDDSGENPKEYLTFHPGVGAPAVTFSLQEDTVIIRHKIKIEALQAGESSFMGWGNLELGLRYADGVLSLILWNTESSRWENTEFNFWDNSSRSWFELDLVRGETNGNVLDMVFVEGNLVGFTQYFDEKKYNEYSISNTPYFEIGLAPGQQSDNYPEFVLRALRSLGIRYEDVDSLIGVEKMGSVKRPSLLLKMPEDVARKKREGNRRFHYEIHSGDLSMDEEAWFMTRTVNRTYFDFVSGIDVRRLPFLERTLAVRGSDYLPTLESRDWELPWGYVDLGDNYIEKIYGYLMLPESGTYRIFISGDEQAYFGISTSTSPADLQPAIVLSEPTGTHEWKKENSVEWHFLAYEPVYFEAWHVENSGSDHFGIAWQIDDSEIELIPSNVISSYSGGTPGTYPRNFVIKDPSFLTEDSPIFDTASVDTVPMDLAGPYNQIDGEATIKLADFPSGGGARFHAFESFGAGMDWLWTDSANWPSVNAIGTGGLDWMWYEQETSNPQVFYDYTESSWLHYYHLPYPRVWYDGKVLPVKWDFNDIGPYDWDQVAAPDDDDDWAWDGQPTSSSGTGPSGDRDFQNGGLPGQYIYLETSSPNPAYTAGKKAMLVSPYLYIEPGESMLHFYYHMYGANMGTLHVDIWSDGAWTNSIWSISGQQHTSTTSPYHRVDISLENTFAERLIKVRIRAVAAGGYRGDLAFDDVIVYTKEKDSDGDGASDGFELLNGTDPIVADFNPAVDADRDLISYEIEMLGKNYGIDGLGDSSQWTENTDIQTEAFTQNLDSLVIVIPESAYSVDYSDLAITPLSN